MAEALDPASRLGGLRRDGRARGHQPGAGTGESLSVIGRNGVGKTTLLATVMGHTTLHQGEVCCSAARASIASRPSPRPGWHRLGSAGARDLPVAHRAREPDDRRPAGALDPGAGVRSVPESGRAALEHGQPAFGRRAADALDRARAPDESVGAAHGRADGRAGAGDRGSARGGAVTAARRGRARSCLVEQNSRVALAFASRTVVMDKGRIVYDGESAALSTDPERLRSAHRRHVWASGLGLVKSSSLSTGTLSRRREAMGLLDGKVAVVTGAGSGIGRGWRWPGRRRRQWW